MVALVTSVERRRFRLVDARAADACRKHHVGSQGSGRSAPPTLSGTPLAPSAPMLGTLVEVLLVALFAVTLLSATVAVAGRLTHQSHGGPAA